MFKDQGKDPVAQMKAQVGHASAHVSLTRSFRDLLCFLFADQGKDPVAQMKAQAEAMQELRRRMGGGGDPHQHTTPKAKVRQLS